MPPKIKKVQKKAEVPLTSSSKSTQDILKGAPSLRTGLSIGPCEIWFKYGDAQPTRVFFEGIVDDLKGEIKKKLSNQLVDVDVTQIMLRKNDEETDLRADFIIDRNFLTSYDTPLQVIVNAHASRKHKIDTVLEKLEEIEKAVSQQKSADRVSVSNLSEIRMREILNCIGFMEEDFEPLKPILCTPFQWGEEAESQQMGEIVKWFCDALKLPRGINVWDIHTDVNYQREIKGANIILTGGSDIAIGPSRTECIWIEAKKSAAECKRGLAIGKLLLIDNRSALNSMVVLTDCNNFWRIYYIINNNNESRIVSCEADRGLTLAIIKQFVIEEGNQFNEWKGKATTCVSEDTIEPLRKKAKLIEYTTEESDERMKLMIDDMSEEELFKMKARQKLMIVRKSCKLDEQPYIDRIISQLSDNYEYLADQHRQSSDCENLQLSMFG
ncbi:30067_t:CDS:2 [Racocetra persica]|uniref:30067_t:CDS:1 n=1 Tax=Racocetra persica TaxID=160502 RepID=A0ACA9Q5S4_9GLOM|nr:30067_t:CDS:2 [Racocetra persica]